MDELAIESVAPVDASPLSLSQFIVNNMQALLQDYNDYTHALFSKAAKNKEILRDHAEELLLAIVADIAQPQYSKTPENEPKGSITYHPAGLEKTGRQGPGWIAERFDLELVIGMFRAVRGSVLRRWAAQQPGEVGSPEQIRRFNDAIDEALAAAVRGHTHIHESIINTSSDAIVGKTTEGVITSWNPSAERIFGYTAQEAIGQSTEILFLAEHLTEERDILARIARGETVPSFDAVRLRKDGTHVCVSVTVSPITDGHGTIVGASKIARDISQRKQTELELRASEERFRALADAIPQMAWTARADGSRFWYNQRWYDFTGTTPEQMQGSQVCATSCSIHAARPLR